MLANNPETASSPSGNCSSLHEKTFIVRIYRKNDRDHEVLVGTVEDVACNTRGTFRTRKELMGLLAGQGPLIGS